MIYAPVVIPTLNRDVHLKRCIDSLQRNKWAHLTELYISLDYPPAEKYMEGYKKVKAFLDKDIFGFRAVHIFIQKENLGAVGNTDFLVERIVEDGYDRYIFSEDDNQFSPNFLEYMDKNLDYFQNDEKALGVCAALKDDSWHTNKGNIILQYVCPAYGLGCWVNKDKQAKQHLNSGFINEIGENSDLFNKIRRRSKLCFRAYMSSVVYGRNNIFWDQGSVIYCDTIRSLYAMATDSYHVAPIKGKVRNWGHDGMGLNMKKTSMNPEEYYKLDDEEDFDIKLPEPFCVDPRNTKINNRQARIGFRKYLVTCIAYGIYLLLGRNYRKCISLKKRVLHGKD